MMFRFLTFKKLEIVTFLTFTSHPKTAPLTGELTENEHSLLTIC